MAYRRTADTSCPDGPCPVMAIDDTRGTTAIQGYDPKHGAASLDEEMGPQPAGEYRIEMRSTVFEDLLAQHLTDAALDRIQALRASLRADV
jgi:hypothetical protein